MLSLEEERGLLSNSYLLEKSIDKYVIPAVAGASLHQLTNPALISRIMETFREGISEEIYISALLLIDESRALADIPFFTPTRDFYTRSASSLFLMIEMTYDKILKRIKELMDRGRKFDPEVNLLFTPMNPILSRKAFLIVA